MEVNNLFGLGTSVESISYTPRGMKPVGTCTNPETGKKFVIFELPKRDNRVSNFLQRLDSYKDTHYMSRIKKDPFSFDALGFLSMLGVNIENKSEVYAFALGAYAYRMLEDTTTSKCFSEALHKMDSPERGEVREKNIRIITSSISDNSRAMQIAKVIRIMASKKINFNVMKMIEDLLYKDSKSLRNSWVQEFYGVTSNDEEGQNA